YPSDDRGQGRAQFMRQRREKLVLRPVGIFEFGRSLGDASFEFVSGPPHRVEGISMFGHIAHDLGETAQMSVFVTQRRDDDIRPKPRAILAITPALFFEAPIS